MLNRTNSLACVCLDENEERSFKRELELFENDVQDEWELDDSEYLSKEELQEADEREKKMLKNNDKDSSEDNKRWLDVDAPKNGMYTLPFSFPLTCFRARIKLEVGMIVCIDE